MARPRSILYWRTNRATYWTWLLGVLAIVYGLWLIGASLPISGTFVLLICAPRLHDLGRSGWWGVGIAIAYELLYAIGYEGGLAANLLNLAPFAVFGLLALLGAWPGDRSRNKFGVPPRRGVANMLALHAQPAEAEDVADNFS